MRITVDAGKHMRVECPILIPVQEGTECPNGLKSKTKGRIMPCQITKDKEGRTFLAFVLEFLPAGETDVLEGTEITADGGVELRRGDDHLSAIVDGNLLTTYHFSRNFPKPFFFPVVGPYGVQISRSYPMVDVTGESKDHPHHRSLWTSHGDVNGANFWSEEEGSGTQVHLAFPKVESGSVIGTMASLVSWVGNSGEQVLVEERELVFYKTAPHLRMFELSTSLYAIDHDIRFGDTKEGGLFSIRVATPICEENGGRIENSFGGWGEPEAWGRRAQWCNYSGQVSKDTVEGVAVLDHPSNPRHPTYWHVRSYGLFAANPFGVSNFTGDDRMRGDMIIRAGSKATFRYRVILHLGYASEANIHNKFVDFVFPPKVKLED